MLSVENKPIIMSAILMSVILCPNAESQHGLSSYAECQYGLELVCCESFF